MSGMNRIKQNNSICNVDFARPARDVITDLKQTWTEFDGASDGKNDNLVTREDCLAVLASGNTSKRAKDVAQVLLAKPDFFDALEVAQWNGPRDGQIGLGDVDTMIERFDPAWEARIGHVKIQEFPKETATAKAWRTILENYEAVRALHPVGEYWINIETLSTAARCCDLKPEVRAAAAYIANDPAHFRAVDHGYAKHAKQPGWEDSIIGTWDIEWMLNGAK